MLTFLKKHYEKVVFIAFLIVFVVALVWQIQIIMAAFVNPDKLVVEKKKADYRRIDLASYNAVKNLEEEAGWKKSVARNKKDRDYTDLLNPIKAARCPHCSKIIPESNFSIDHKCSMCGQRLEELKWEEDTNLDTDGDGIPDKVEIEIGLNDKDPNDIFGDLDGDGFSNIYEYKTSKTKLNDPKSRPALIDRVIVTKIKRTKLPIMIKSVKTHNSDDKSTWSIQGEDKRRRSKFWTLNEVIKIGKDKYKITDVNYKTVKKLQKSLKTYKDIDVSEVKLERLNSKGDVGTSEPVIATVGKIVFEPKEKVSLKDVISGKRYKSLYENDTFAVGEKRTGLEKYIILKVIPARNSIEVKEVGGAGKKYIVKNNSILEEDKAQLDNARKTEKRADVPPEMDESMFKFKKNRKRRK